MKKHNTLLADKNWNTILARKCLNAAESYNMKWNLIMTNIQTV